MKNHHLRVVITLGTIVLIGLMTVQLYWFRKAFDVAEKQFDHRVQVAMKRVADSVSGHAQIKKLSSNFFLAATESELNEKMLDTLLKKEFLLRDLDVDYELGVYNAEDDTLVYGHYVEATRKRRALEEPNVKQKHEADKNFAIYFPRKKSYLAAELDIWIFSTALLLLMTGFFAYAIASLLRERKFAELKNDFINNMTHEFKTPVTNISIAGEILKNKMKNQEANQIYVDIVLKENEKLRRKIESVLENASIDHIGRPTLEKMDIHQLIKNCAEVFQLKVEERQGKFQLELKATRAAVMGDRDLLAQAISNVIDNAEKYSPSAPHIIIRTRDVSAGGIEIDIVDEGIGIPGSLTRKIFEKFFRVQTGNVHNVKGFGLGLSFVQQVIRKHRGEVRVFSELNKGTEVKIFLPGA
jgi:two-component system phosphate regulon sensor histidine kinase PhoR